MKLQYVITATKPDGQRLFWTGTGFSSKPELAFRCDSLDFADLTARLEKADHPYWEFKFRVYEHAA